MTYFTRRPAADQLLEAISQAPSLAGLAPLAALTRYYASATRDGLEAAAAERRRTLEEMGPLPDDERQSA